MEVLCKRGVHLKVIRFLKPYRIAMAVAWSLMLVELAVELLNPLFMARIIDEGIMNGDLNVVLKWGFIMVGMSLLAFISGVTNSFFAAHTSQGFGYDVRESLYKKVQSFSFASFHKLPTASLITRMTNDVRQLQNTIFMSLRIMLRAPLLVVGSTIMALIVNVRLALILFIVIPVLWVFLLWVLKRGWSFFERVQSRLDKVNEVMKENLSGMRLIKAYTRSKYEEGRFHGANEDLKDRTVRALRFMEIIMPLLMLVMNLALLSVLWFGSIDVASGGASVGEVVAIVTYVTRISSVFSIFSFIITSFSRARASAGRVEEVLQTEVDLKDGEEARQENTVVNGEIAFRDVSFQYPSTRGKVLEGVSFKVEAGETVSILGATGSGKTSLFQLIPRLYDATEGSVELDGQCIRSIPLNHVRKNIGYVPQEAVLFSGSVSENLQWGKEEATREEMIQAAKDAQIHETIMNLSNGYDTVLGQKGVNLSGGQKQRLSIARALIRKPKILLLDDSTSALDLKTESKLLQALKQYECTTMIITQKISTAMESDTILLLEDGVLIGEGTHTSLLEDSTLYQRIFQSQFGEEEIHRV
ncbi:ABC transporter ATP-binding protein [Rossellomorea aquimaris]|uniref:ABC transporter ATP-binding protein n=1 Tax=Rossellomorea aquimaris TaxID=189382 RepID=A0A5D4UKY6_9BACI|nr:ABC transporter ATP-binding protein [Rossellomorea aquimaris]TYS81321.1 ABC transporter ATP-binding protein [Rossellomorea aquimaris]TYS87943.1 ABC transporter ATP-binding protein [Rossellomorea aquimaris]